ncbi:cytochrome c oxidase subunit II [Glaciimonas soli]|uniref:cytochrome-c oxidase n=1 Tax=Glaciimonas soli TaxID=2590999 RepID=A0A843YQB1_9BURK|nr:cytochrome c oxidase subunit II [Glaciimonas soli]MQR01969.1 c-type cytochrome [Glaciimonas soli]
MLMAISLIIIVAATLLFHFYTPWWATPLASNWQQMDNTLTITFAITGIFFVAINIFIIYTLLRFRHRKEGDAAQLNSKGSNHRAAYQPENKKLEYWLIAITSIAIIGLLAPGLFVYAAYIKAPANAIDVEVLGQQWQWHFRFPGADGKLGRTSVALVSASNPFGLDPHDAISQNNILIMTNELHLPLNQPVRMLLHSQDVLHDFFVPQFRARMNMVPGMITSFWFTPTKTGRFEVLCAQLCGVGHYNMRAYVVVDDPATFQAWLKKQPTFAMTLAAAQNVAMSNDPLIEKGKALYNAKACVSCHSLDGSARVGPSWKGLYGKTETMADGSTAMVDETYLRNFIHDPQARTVKGYSPIMPKIEMSDEELAALIALIKSYGIKSETKQTADIAKQ